MCLSAEQVYASVALTTESKHHRNIHYFGPTTLRATVCYNLVRLGEPRLGDVIVDPLCGGGSIPIEVRRDKHFHNWEKLMFLLYWHYQLCL